MVSSKDEHIAGLAEALGIPQLLTVNLDFDTRFDRHWAQQPVQGKGATNWTYHPAANHWLKGQTFSSGEFIAALLLRTNTFPPGKRWPDLNLVWKQSAGDVVKL